MRCLIDIGHPAHVHLFRNFASEMIHRGHEILFTCREKEFEIQLLKNYKLQYHSFGKKYSTFLGKILGILKFDFMMYKVGHEFQPDLFLSHGSINAAHASFLLRKPHIAFEDTYNSEQIWLYKPFTNAILTSDYDHPLKSKKVLKYKGYHELAYLHPNRFTPDILIKNELGVAEGQKYVILRFVSWKASHDFGHTGISMVNKLKAIESFSNHSKVFISSESDLPDELKKYQINILPHKIHDAIAFASLLFGESSTMSEEAAMLGTPSIYINTNSTYFTKHLENEHSLLFNYPETKEGQIEAIIKGVELLQTPDIKKEWLLRRNKMLVNRIDVTEFLIWFVENWPESCKIMKENPVLQQSFI